MFSFSLRKKKNDPLLIIDIGSGSVGALIERDGNVEECFRKEYSLGDTATLDQHERAIDRTLGAVLGRIAKHSTHPKTAYCFLATPWHIPEIRTVHISKETPFSFGQKECALAIRKDRETFESDLEKNYRKKGHGIIAMEEHVLSVLVNGYEVDLQSSYTTKQVTISYYLGLSDTRLLAKIRDRMERHTGVRTVLFSSSTYAWFGAVKKAGGGPDDYLLVVVEDAVTTLSVISNSGLTAVHSFPQGKNHVVRALGRELGAEEKEVFSKLTLFTKGVSDEKEKARMQKALRTACGLWVTELRRALASLAHRLSLPDEILLSTSAAWAPIFESAIKTEDFAQIMLTEKKFTITHADPVRKMRSVDMNPGECTDRALLMETMFASNVNEK